jgi:hypothetical protein
MISPLARVIVLVVEGEFIFEHGKRGDRGKNVAYQVISPADAKPKSFDPCRPSVN